MILSTMDVRAIFLLTLGLTSTSYALTSQSSTDDSITLEDYEASILPNRSICGNIKETPRIYGGIATEIGELPWMVALEYKTVSTGIVSGINCVASLISERFLLSSANCVTNTNRVPENAILGDWNLATNPDCVNGKDCAESIKKIKIEKLIPHENYNPNQGENDIALLRLSEDVAFTEFISPICLPPKNLPFPKLGEEVTVAGWGKTESGKLSEILLKVDLPLVSNKECGEKLKRAIGEDRFCAGGKPGKDSCTGDSGSPAIRVYGNKVDRARWFQHGIVSAGSTKCGTDGFAGIYTRVDRFMNWIVTNIKNSSTS